MVLSDLKAMFLTLRYYFKCMVDVVFENLCEYDIITCLYCFFSVPCVSKYNSLVEIGASTY